MRRSPVTVGLVLGLVVGAAAAAAVATAEPGRLQSRPRLSSHARSRPSSRPSSHAHATGRPRPPGPRIVVAASNPPKSPGAAPLDVRATLPSLGGRARGYSLGDTPPPGAIARLADALNVHGSVESDGGGWLVRDANRLVRVTRTPGLPWYLTAPQGACVTVPSGALPPVPPAGSTDCTQVAGPSAGGVRPPDLPGRDDALAFGMEILGKAGLGVARPVILDQGTSWHIDAAPMVGDTPTSGFGWTITVGPAFTVAAASGFLAVPVPAQSYRLVGTAQGLERARLVASGTVTGVRRGLMLGRVGDSSYLVPAYLFELGGPADAPPLVAAVPAVEDRYLA